jgi:hypothetical protein
VFTCACECRPESTRLSIALLRACVCVRVCVCVFVCACECRPESTRPSIALLPLHPDAAVHYIVDVALDLGVHSGVEIHVDVTST